MTTLNTNQDSTVRPDESLRAEILEALWRRPEIRWLDIDSITVIVRQGVVTLSGHINKESNFHLISGIVESISGVIRVDNQLVVDRELTLRIAQALAEEARTKSLILPVGTVHGWVRFGGEVPTHEHQIVVEEVTAKVPGVRGIVLLPKLPRESQLQERRALQPRVSAKVYSEDGLLGTVIQVIIQPRNRLVTHVVLEAEGFENGNFFRCEYLVPADAIERVNEESVFLKRKTPLSVVPAFDPSAYPLAPVDWQPPYPYASGMVRWSRETRESSENGSNATLTFQMQTAAAGQ